MRRLLALSLLLSALFLVGDPIHAQATPVSPPSILSSLDPDGEPCTAVPDAIPGVFDFTAACIRHDTCYAAGGDRLACDRAFRGDMIAACAVQHADAYDARRHTCRAFAELYYAGVRLFGGLYFPSG